MLDTILFCIKREFREFAEDLEVEVLDVWDNIRDLFQKEEL